MIALQICNKPFKLIGSPKLMSEVSWGFAKNIPTKSFKHFWFFQKQSTYTR